MNVHDSSPDRRNLIVLSLSIIVFYLGGGKLAENSDSVKLQVINVTLENPQILVTIIWGMLFWFVYRYWLLNKDSWLEVYRSEMVEIFNSKLLSHFKKYFEKKLNLEVDETLIGTILINSTTTPPGRGLKFKHNVQESSAGPKNVFSSLSKVYDYFIMTVCTVLTTILKPTLTTYFTPYFLFAIAVALGLSNWIVYNLGWF